ncbi:serine/threonine-protein kinase STY13 [Pelomyxa schiedti]|nr:serine/threonine-protein kinase STY13 [Pelomyxa schiedti]
MGDEKNEEPVPTPTSTTTPNTSTVHHHHTGHHSPENYEGNSNPPPSHNSTPAATADGGHDHHHHHHEEHGENQHRARTPSSSSTSPPPSAASSHNGIADSSTTHHHTPNSARSHHHESPRSPPHDAAVTSPTTSATTSSQPPNEPNQSNEISTSADHSSQNHHRRNSHNPNSKHHHSQQQQHHRHHASESPRTLTSSDPSASHNPPAEPAPSGSSLSSAPSSLRSSACSLSSYSSTSSLRGGSANGTPDGGTDKTTSGSSAGELGDNRSLSEPRLNAPGAAESSSCSSDKSASVHSVCMASAATTAAAASASSAASGSVSASSSFCSSSSFSTASAAAASSSAAAFGRESGSFATSRSLSNSVKLSPSFVKQNANVLNTSFGLIELQHEAEAREMKQLVRSKAHLEEMVNRAIAGEVSFHNELPVDSITLGELVGKGASGMVFRGVVDGRTVAVKKYGPDNMGWDPKEFRREITLMSVLDCPYLLGCVGACTQDTDKLFLVTELMPNSLSALIKKQILPLSLKLYIGLCVARGMSYLHNLEIIHRDLKPHNVLLSDDFKVKIIDFGTSRVIDVDKGMTKQVGTVCYMAPELFKSDHYTQAIDVYSFAILFWEVLTQKEPYENASSFRIPVMVSNGERPAIPTDMLPALAELLQTCWSGEPDTRPPFSSICTTLETLLSEIDPTFLSSATIESTVPTPLTPSSEKNSFFFIGRGKFVYAYKCNYQPENPVTLCWTAALEKKGHKLLAKAAVTMVFDLSTDILYALCYGSLHSIDGNDGKMKWIKTYPEQERTPCLSLKLMENSLFVGGNKHVLCVSKNNGEKVWSTQLPDRGAFTFIVHMIVTSTIVYAAGVSHVYILDIKTGLIKTTVFLETAVSCPVCLNVQQDSLVYASVPGKICLIPITDFSAAPSAAAVTKFKTPYLVNQLQHPTDTNQLFVGYASRINPKVKALTNKTLEKRWSITLALPAFLYVSLAICPRIPGTLFVGTGGYVIAVDTATGDEKGKLSLPGCGYSDVYLMPLATVIPLFIATCGGAWYLIKGDLVLVHKGTLKSSIRPAEACVTSATMFWSMNEHANAYLV